MQIQSHRLSIHFGYERKWKKNNIWHCDENTQRELVIVVIDVMVVDDAKGDL